MTAVAIQTIIGSGRCTPNGIRFFYDFNVIVRNKCDTSKMCTVLAQNTACLVLRDGNIIKIRIIIVVP